jgi:hypothetical protein
MQQYIDQAEHNLEFHNCIHGQFNDRFFDWKITALFYTAIHYLKALADQRRINIGQTHQDIERNVNPERPNPIMPITKNAWRAYKALYRYSHTARYEGVTDIKTFNTLKEIDYGFAKQNLVFFAKYIKGQGVTIEIPTL